jgi:hypothetical protein
MKLVRLALLSLITGCLDDGVGKKGDDPFVLEDNGKADGSGLLSTQDQKRLEVAFDQAIAAGEATVQQLEKEIAKLETSNAAKQAEADAIVARIAAREQEIRDQANRNLILCAFFPDPSICFVANIIANDSTLRTYRQQLDAARAEQQKIRNEIAAYTTKRDALRTKLGPIRDGKQQLLAMLRDGTTPTKLPVRIAIADRGFTLLASEFGPRAFNAMGPLALVDDGSGTRSDGCEASPAGSLAGKIAVLDRGSCDFTVKVANAQAAGALGVIIANDRTGVASVPGNGQMTAPITIPSGMVTKTDGAALKLFGGRDASILDHEIERSPQTASAWAKQAVMSKIATTIGTEIAVLVDIRNAAVELSNTLDQSLATMRELEHSVAELVAKQRQDFMDKLFDMLSGDPASLAEAWLEDALAARTKELIAQLEFPLNEVVRYLVESRGGQGDVDALIKRLLDKLGTGLPPFLVSTTTPVSILDHTDAQSAITVTDTRSIASLEVFVDIQHTYIGDLIVTLEHDGKKFVLASKAGGSAKNLVKTFSVPAAVGTSLGGKWVLHVEDVADQDTGQLRRWDLIAR